MVETSDPVAMDLTAIQIKMLDFMNTLVRQSFVKPDDLVYPDVDATGLCDGAAFRKFLEDLGYVGWNGQLRLAYWVIAKHVTFESSSSFYLFK